MKERQWVAILFSALTTLFAAYNPACADPVGPLPYASLADSPFDVTRNGIDFFVEDFSQPVERFYRELPPYGIRFPFARFTTPGVEVDGFVGWTGSTISTVGACTDSIPGSCFSSLGFAFDSLELGFLPQAVGVAFSGFGNLSLSAYDAQNQSVETAIAEFDLAAYLAELQPLPGEIIALPPPDTIFLGVTYAEGISRIVLHSNTVMFELDDFQYGQLTPEPSSLVLAVLGVSAVIGFRSRRFAGRQN